MSAPAETNATRLEHHRLPCGCEMAIARDRVTAITIARTIHRRSQWCRSRLHQPGERVYVWELLPRPLATS